MKSFGKARRLRWSRSGGRWSGREDEVGGAEVVAELVGGLYYLAAASVPPFDDEEVLIETLTTVWTSIPYGDSAPQLQSVPVRANGADTSLDGHDPQSPVADDHRDLGGDHRPEPR
jgi:hypothetical protein